MARSVEPAGDVFVGGECVSVFESIQGSSDCRSRNKAVAQILSWLLPAKVCAYLFPCPYSLITAFC